MTESDSPSPEGATDGHAGQRLAKAIARAGLCSRRDAERWIADGRVAVNGERVTTPALNVTDADAVTVDGTPLPAAEPTRLWRYHKPRGLVTTAKDEHGRETVFDRLPEGMPRVLSIGRLDLNSEGLLLLTNDGDLARRLELPATGWVRRYRVRVFGTVDPDRLARLADGVTIDGVRYGPVRAELEAQQSSNAWVVVSLAEGKNREVRRVMEHLGYPVNRLIRVAYGPFQLGRLPRGGVEEVTPRVLREQLGLLEGRKPDRTGFAKAKPRPKKPGGPKGAPGKGAPAKGAAKKAAAKKAAAKGASAKSAPAKHGGAGRSAAGRGRAAPGRKG